jgi:hypothetical protein
MNKTTRKLRTKILNAALKSPAHLKISFRTTGVTKHLTSIEKRLELTVHI